MRKRTDLPCWCGEGRSSATKYFEPIPHYTCYKCENENTGKHATLWEGMDGYQEYDEVVSTGMSNPLQVMKEFTNNPTKGNNIKMERPPLQRGIVAPLEDRGIRKEVAEKYGVETLFNEENVAFARSYPGHNKDKELIAQKLKRVLGDKGMKWAGEPGQATLFGQAAFNPGGKYVTITEGEEDTLAVYQMLLDYNPKFEPVVVSIKDGAAAAERDVKASYEFINSFDNIIICFDGDGPGRKAAAKVAQMFPFKSKVVNFNEITLDEGKYSLKDGNDYLKAGKQKDFIRMWWDAEKYVPKGVTPFRSLWDAMTSKDTNLTVPYPWEGLNKKLHGMRTGEMVVIKAFPKQGKTLYCRHLAKHIRDTTPYNVGLILLEDTKKTIGLGMCALHIGRPIQIPDVPFTMEELKAAHDYLSEDDRITVFDPEDERTVENIFNKIMFFVKAHDCKFIFLDHASMLAYSSGDFDERKFLDKLFADLKALTTQLDIHITVVVHVNDDGKTRGSRAPVQLCNALIFLDRDKLNDDPIIANTTDIVVEENRISGDSGLACKLYYDPDTGMLTEMDLALIEEQEKKKDLGKMKDMFDK